MWPQSDPAGKAGSFNLPIVPSPSVCKHFGNPRACLPNRPDFKFTAYHSGGFRQDFFLSLSFGLLLCQLKIMNHYVMGVSGNKQFLDSS